MRLFAIFALILVSHAPGALADEYDDCFANQDPKVLIRGCSVIIKNGKHSCNDHRYLAYCIRGAAGTLLRRGNGFAVIRQRDRAISDYNDAIKAAPLWHESYRSRARAYIEKGQFEFAIDDASTVIELEPRDGKGYNLRAWIYYKLGKLEDGLRDANKAIELSQFWGYPFDTRAHIYEALGRKPQAISDYRKALQYEPGLKESQEGLKRLGVRP